MKRVPLHLLDSVGFITPEMAGAVLVTGSHGGDSAARFALAAPPLLVVFNDAGGGLHQAGISGLDVLQSHAIAAATVAHTSARIGYAQSTLDEGVLSHVNPAAAALGLFPGQRCRDAVRGWCDLPGP
jgi:hypothetical protein